MNAEPEIRVAALDALHAELSGHRLLVVDDLDGNQLFLNDPSEATLPKIAGDEATG